MMVGILAGFCILISLFYDQKPIRRLAFDWDSCFYLVLSRVSQGVIVLTKSRSRRGDIHQRSNNRRYHHYDNLHPIVFRVSEKLLTKVWRMLGKKRWLSCLILLCSNHTTMGGCPYQPNTRMRRIALWRNVEKRCKLFCWNVSGNYGCKGLCYILEVEVSCALKWILRLGGINSKDGKPYGLMRWKWRYLLLDFSLNLIFF